MTKKIKLTQNQFALVDDKDYKELNKSKWYISKAASSTYYAVLSGGRGLMHRQILKLESGDEKTTDHINRNGLDNRRSNLRIVSKSVNAQNHHKYNTNTSGHTGVSWAEHAQSWRAYIMVNYKTIYLGYFKDIKDAITARKKAEQKYWAL